MSSGTSCWPVSQQYRSGFSISMISANCVSCGEEGTGGASEGVAEGRSAGARVEVARTAGVECGGCGGTSGRRRVWIRECYSVHARGK